MLNEIMNHKKQVFIVGLLVFILVLIRFFEENLFYDPFLAFFKSKFQGKPLPDYESFKLYLNVSLRYIANAIISLGILHVLFNDKKITKLSINLYLILFLILFLLFVLILNFSNHHMLLFYVRRFLIQPLFLILLIPAFYYQKINK